MHVRIDHEAVEGSPLQLEAQPGAPCLAASRVDESALMSAVAGEPCFVKLTAFNEFGQPIGAGGAIMTAALMCHGEHCWRAATHLAWTMSHTQKAHCCHWYHCNGCGITFAD